MPRLSAGALCAAALLVVLLTAGSPARAQGQAASDREAQNALWDGAIRGDTAAMTMALAAGAAIDSLDTRQNPNGRRALNWAAWYDHAPAVRFLLAHGAQVNLGNRTGYTPLHHAAENGAVGAARVLLEFGADRAAVNGEGETPAEVGARRGQLEVVSLLRGSQ
jgi:hypothetical protein